MITTGIPRTSATRKTEIVDVANGVGCSDLDDFPDRISDAVGANLDGTPVVCGGFSSYSGYLEKCYRFTNIGWVEFASMKEKRLWAAGVVYKKKLHMFGGSGLDGSTSEQTSEIISVDGKVIDGPDLPKSVTYHAMTAINDTVSLLSGGETNAKWYSAKTWYYNHDTEAFTSGPKLLKGRIWHGSATVVDKVTKEKAVVVTGGYRNGNHLDTTEMLINGQWQIGTIQFRKQNCLICPRARFSIFDFCSH